MIAILLEFGNIAPEIVLILLQHFYTTAACYALYRELLKHAD